MRKIFASFLGLILLAPPVLVFADDDLTSLQLQVKHLTAIAAAIETQERVLAGEFFACTLVTSKSSVRVNEPFVLAWSSVGAMSPGDDATISVLAPNDASMVTLSKPGLWTYRLTFYAKNGATTTCSTPVVVTAA